MTRTRVIFALSVLASLAVVGIGAWRLVKAIQGSSPSVKTLEHSIEGGLDDQLMAQAINYQGPPTASVTCPKNAPLKTGSVFYCDASITFIKTDTTAIGAPDVNTEEHRIKVTMTAGAKARWQVVS
jgi:hypothetical protein